MRSGSLQQALQPDEGRLAAAMAGPRQDEAYSRAEAVFKELPLPEKVRLVMAFRPTIFQIESTSRCNLNCPLCSTHHLRRGYTEMPLEWVEGIAADNPAMHYACLHLMGEPLLSGSVFDIVASLKTRGIYTYFATNGMLLEEKAEAVVRSGLDKISISLDGMTQDDLGIYRRGADLEKILRGIEALRRERNRQKRSTPLIQVQTVMFPYNEAKEAALKRFIRGLGVDRIKFKKPSFESFGGRNETSGAFGRFAAAGQGKYSRRQEGYKTYRETAVCRLLFQGFVLSDGAVVPCCIDYDGEYAFGNLRERGWREIWNSNARRTMLERFFEGHLDICRTCTLGYDYSRTVWENNPR